MVAVAILLGACATSGRREAAGLPQLAQRWHYDVTFDAELTQADATVCFEGPVPAELRAGLDRAAVHLRYARWLSPGAVRRLPVHGGRIQLDASARDACVAYGVELRDNAEVDSAVRRVGEKSLLASPNVWLWRPQRRATQASATLEVHLPDSMRVSLPWPRRGSRYALGPEAFRFHAYAALGEFEGVSEEHRGVPLELVRLEGDLRIDLAAARRWLRSAVDVAALGPGGPPKDGLQVILVPSGPASEPVLFGTVARGGRGSVLLFVSSQATEEELLVDWVLPHELSHLFSPYVGREHAWFTEGVATYYQEVLRARAGLLSESQAFLNLARSMRAAAHEGTGRTLREESRDMYATRAFRPVYWGGAAYFLLADLTLRDRSQGRVSLDSVLAALREESPGEAWALQALLARMDELAGMPVFVPLAEACLARPFPEVEPALVRMGLAEDALALRDAAPWEDLRRAILRVQPAPAAMPREAQR